MNPQQEEAASQKKWVNVKRNHQSACAALTEVPVYENRQSYKTPTKWGEGIFKLWMFADNEDVLSNSWNCPADFY